MPADHTPERSERWPAVLRTWASLGAALRARRTRTPPSWDAVTRLIDAAKPKLEQDKQRLRELLDESRRLLDPLEDPFAIDLGLHRWLDGEREEAYSDWLAWVVEQAGTAGRVFRLFGIEELPDGLSETAAVTVERECSIPYGHEDHGGRLDLVIRCGDRAVLVVEVKVVGAEEADTVKHAGYLRWIGDQPQPCKHPIFLATSADAAEYEGFTFLGWSALCVAMRRLVVTLREEKRATTAAMVLAFAGAVEQNLLGLSARAFNPRVVEYLERVLKWAPRAQRGL